MSILNYWLGPFAGGTWSYAKNLSLNYTGRSGSVLQESVNGLDAQLLSPCFKGASASWYSIAALSLGTTHTIVIPTNLDGITASQGMLFGTSSYLNYEPSVKRFRYNINAANYYLTMTTVPTGFHVYKIVRVGTALTLLCDNEQIASTTILEANNITFTISTIFRNGSSYSPDMWCPYFGVINSSADFMLALNNPTKPQDVSGNNRLFNANGITAANLVYRAAGGGLNDTGYSVWSDGTNTYYLPHYNGTPLPAVNTAFYTGCTRVKNVAADTNSISSELPSYIDFDPMDSANALLDVFNLANTTIYSDAARALSFYDAANTYRWSPEYISDPRLYMPLLNVGYRGRVYSISTITSRVVSQLNGLLAYRKDKIGNDEWNAMKYTGSSVLAAYPDGTYTVDAYGYVEFYTIAYSDSFGTSAAKTAYQNSAIINELVASGDYNEVVIGSSATDVYLLSQPICPNNVNITYNCILTMMPSVTDTVTANIATGSSTITVTNGAKFHVGEWVCVTDTNQFYSYGQYRGWGGKIIDITGNVLTLDSVSAYDYTTAASAYVGTLQSVILMDAASNVRIKQTGGYIDANRAGQISSHPTRYLGGGIVEHYKMACGIVGYKSSNITLDSSVVVKNAPMHGVSFSSDYTDVLNKNITLGNVHVYNSHEKGFHFKWCETVRCGDLYSEVSTWEDGVTCYAQMTDVTFGNVTVKDCGRHGFVWNNVCTGLHATSVTATNCDVSGVAINSPDATIGSIVTDSRVRITDVYGTYLQVKNINIGSIEITNSINAPTTGILEFVGDVSGIVIGSATLTGCTGIGINATTGATSAVPTNVDINSGGIYTHTGTKVYLADGADVTLIGDFS